MNLIFNAIEVQKKKHSVYPIYFVDYPLIIIVSYIWRMTVELEIDERIVSIVFIWKKNIIINFMQYITATTLLTGVHIDDTRRRYTLLITRECHRMLFACNIVIEVERLLCKTHINARVLLRCRIRIIRRE